MVLDIPGDEAIRKASVQGDPSDGKDIYIRVLNGWVTQKTGRKITAAYPTASQESFTFKQGATTVMVLLVSYTDATKTVLTEVERTT